MHNSIILPGSVQYIKHVKKCKWTQMKRFKIITKKNVENKRFHEMWIIMDNLLANRLAFCSPCSKGQFCYFKFKTMSPCLFWLRPLLIPMPRNWSWRRIYKCMWTVELYLIHWKGLSHDPLERISRVHWRQGDIVYLWNLKKKGTTFVF